MVDYEATGGEDPLLYAQEVLDNSRGAMGDALDVLVGDREADPFAVLPGAVPAANMPRDTAQPLELSVEQESRLRLAVAELGFGREDNRTLSELHLHNAHAVIEGGQAHKIAAEAAVVVHDVQAQPSSLIFSASGARAISAKEAEVAHRTLGLGEDEQVGKTEYEIARQVAERLPGFTANVNGEDIVHDFGYDIGNNNQTSNELTGQLVTIGTIDGTPVRLLRIDREDYIDEETGKNKFRNQPDRAEVLKLVSQFNDRTEPEGERKPLAFVTSGTYQPSREVDGARAAIETGRMVGVASYGTEQLATIKGEATPAPAPIDQLPGELRTAAESITKLEALLVAQNQNPETEA